MKPENNQQKSQLIMNCLEITAVIFGIKQKGGMPVKTSKPFGILSVLIFIYIFFLQVKCTQTQESTQFTL